MVDGNAIASQEHEGEGKQILRNSWRDHGALRSARSLAQTLTERRLERRNKVEVEIEPDRAIGLFFNERRAVGVVVVILPFRCS